MNLLREYIRELIEVTEYDDDEPNTPEAKLAMLVMELETDQALMMFEMLATTDQLDLDLLGLELDKRLQTKQKEPWPASPGKKPDPFTALLDWQGVVSSTNRFITGDGINRIFNPSMDSYERGDWADTLSMALRQTVTAWKKKAQDGPAMAEHKEEWIVRECVRRILSEKDNSAGPGFKYIHRGMKIDIGSAPLASQIRKVAQKKSAGISEREAGAFIMAKLKNEEIGESWTTNRDIASNFADVWEATNRGSTLHVMFTGKIPNDFGYDPTTTGEEPAMFDDESEVRIPKGEEIEISSVSVFIASKASGKNWMKFRPVAFSLGRVRA